MKIHNEGPIDGTETPAPSKKKSKTKDHKYQVIVGNIGTVYTGSNKTVASGIFDEYSTQSKRKIGRAAGEAVTLLGDGHIDKEYTPAKFGGLTYTISNGIGGQITVDNGIALDNEIIWMLDNGIEPSNITIKVSL